MFDQLMPSLDQVIAFFSITWSGWLVSALIITGGQISKGIARAQGWRGENRIYDLTLRAHPIVAGFLFGLIPFPTFEAIESIQPTGAMVLVRCCYFAGWGCISGQLFELGKFGKKWIRRYVELKTGVRMTVDEVPGDPDETDPATPRAKRRAEEMTETLEPSDVVDDDEESAPPARAAATIEAMHATIPPRPPKTR